MKVCRTCLQVLNSNAKCVAVSTDGCNNTGMDSASIRSKLLVCVPEVAIDVDSAVICTSCSDALDTAYKFRNRCLQTEEQILHYVQFTGCSTDAIRVSEVAEFNQQANSDNDSVEIKQQLSDAHYPITQIIEHDGDDLDIKPIMESCDRDETDASMQSFLYNFGIRPVKMQDSDKGGNGSFPPNSLFFSPELDVEVRSYRSDGIDLLQNVHHLDEGNPFLPVITDGDTSSLLHCVQCPKSFPLVSELEAHLSIHNMESRPLKCTMCERRFVRKDKLQLHMRIHTGEKPFQCTLCGRCFSRKDKLNNHMRTHTGEKPHQCILCQKSFARKDKMNTHMKSQHWLALANLEITVVKNAGLTATNPPENNGAENTNSQ